MTHQTPLLRRMRQRLQGGAERWNCAGLDWEPVFVDFFNGETRTPEYRRDVNAMGEAPVLVDGDIAPHPVRRDPGLHHRKTGKFGGETRRRARARCCAGCSGTTTSSRSQAGHAAVPDELPARGEAPARGDRLPAGPPARPPCKCSTRISHGRDWIVGDGVTIADLACCGYLYYPEPFGFDRADWPHIDAWLTRIAALPGWKHPYDLMPGYRPRDRRLRRELTRRRHDRRLYLRRHPHAARQGPQGRRAARSDRRRALGAGAERAEGAQRTSKATPSRT